MRGYLVDVANDDAREVEVTDVDQLRQLYRLTRCDCIDIARRTVRGTPLNFVVDDAGFLKEGWRPSAFDGPSCALCGNIVIFGVAADYDLRSLTDGEVEDIECSLVNVYDVDKGVGWPAVMLG